MGVRAAGLANGIPRRMSLDPTTSRRAIVSSPTTVSPSSTIPNTDTEPRYDTARGCLMISGIMFICFMLMILAMYLFSDSR